MSARPALRPGELDYPYYPFRIAVDAVLVSSTDNLAMQHQRDLFEKAMKREGLVIQHETVGTLLFTMVSTPFQRLCRQAEKMQLYFPLKNSHIEPSRPTCCISLSKVFVTDDHVRHVDAPFQRKFAHLYADYEDECRFFSSCQRQLITHQILTEIDISRDMEASAGERGESVATLDILKHAPLRRRGLPYLLMNEAYQEAYTLHDGSEEEPYFRRMKGERVVSFEEMWAERGGDARKDLASRWCRFWKFQPLNLIREYFGEQIGFYFAWQGTFVSVLWPAAAVGIAVFAFGLAKSVTRSPMSINNCSMVQWDGTEEPVPCHLRTQAARFFSTLSSWCMKSFDNELNAFFAVFMSIWGSLFYQLWRRNNSVLAYQWDSEEFKAMEPDRPQFHGTHVQTDPVTGESEWFYPQFTRAVRMMVSVMVMALCMCTVIISVLSVILFKLTMIGWYCGKELTLVCSALSAWLPALLNTSSTMILGQLYERLAKKLTDWENHRTESEHNNALVIKLFVFQFVNNYTSLFYIAFVRPENHGLQKDGLFGLGPEYRDVCVDGTCGSMLAVQLMSNMIIKPLPKFTKDVVVPYFVRITRLLHFYSGTQRTLDDILKETDASNVLIREWMKPSAGEFALYEFNEKILLFGSTMMFAALFPLAPLIALVIGLVDLRIDAYRLLWFNRRPVPVRANGIGIWLPILAFLQYAAVISNAFIVAFTSDFCQNFFSDILKCSLENRLLIVIVFQNCVLLLKYVLQSVIPTVPTTIRIAQRRKRFVLAHIVEKGDVPNMIYHKKATRRATQAWKARAGGGGRNSEESTFGEQRKKWRSSSSKKTLTGRFAKNSVSTEAAGVDEKKRGGAMPAVSE